MLNRLIQIYCCRLKLRGSTRGQQFGPFGYVKAMDCSHQKKDNHG